MRLIAHKMFPAHYLDCYPLWLQLTVPCSCTGVACVGHASYDSVCTCSSSTTINGQCMGADTTFSDFTRDHGAAIRLLPNALLTLVNVAFRRTAVVPPADINSQWRGMAGSAITAVNGSRMSLQVCTASPSCNSTTLRLFLREYPHSGVHPRLVAQLLYSS